MDDNETALTVSAEIVKRAKMVPTLAKSGEEALDYLKPAKSVSGTNNSFPEVALIDISLPGISGYELASEISAITGGKY